MSIDAFVEFCKDHYPKYLKAQIEYHQELREVLISVTKSKNEKPMGVDYFKIKFEE